MKDAHTFTNYRSWVLTWDIIWYHGEREGDSLRDFQEVRWVPHDHIFSVAPCRLICFRGTPPHQNSTNHRLAVGNSALRFPRQVAVCHQSLGTTQYTNGMERPCPWPKLYSTRKTLSSGPWPVALGTPHMQGLNMRIKWRIIMSDACACVSLITVDKAKP